MRHRRSRVRVRKIDVAQYALPSALALALVSSLASDPVRAQVSPNPGDASASPQVQRLVGTNFTISRLRIDYRVKEDASSEQTERYEIVLNTSTAVDELSQVHLDYDEKVERLEVLEAFTLSADGMRRDVPESSIYEQQSHAGASAAMYPGHKVKVIVFPNLVEGSRVVYQVRRTRLVPYFTKHFSLERRFSVFEDFDDAEVTLTVPKSLPMFVKSGGMEGGEIQKLKDGSRRWHWKLKTREPLKAQHWAGHVDEYSPFVIASSYQDWSQIAAAYQIKAGPAAKVTESVQALADRVTAGITDRRDQADALYRWVAGNIRYVAIYLGNGGLEPNNADSIIANGYGDCKDHVVILEALLAAKGIDSTPTLVGVESGPTLPEVAVLGYFDHAILYIPEFDLYLDSSVRWARFGQLHSGVLDAAALHTRTGTLTRTPASTGGGNSYGIDVVWNIDDRGNAKGEAKIQFSDRYEIELREKISTLTDQNLDRAEQSLMSIAGLRGRARLQLHEAAGDLTRAFRYGVSFQADRFLDFSSPGALRTPMAPVGLDVMENRNGSELPQTNEVPFACYDRTQTVTHRMRFPEHLPIHSVPANRVVSNEGGEYRMDWTWKGQEVTVRHQLRTKAIRGAGKLCKPEDYPAFRTLLQAVGEGFRKEVRYGPFVNLDRRIAGD